MHQYRNIPTRHPRQGFSLIELMIVIAIIAVLSAVAVPRYQDYVTRARWSVNLSQLEPLKLAIAECLQQEGGLPGACDTATKLGLADLPTPQHAASAASLASSGSDSLRITLDGTAAAGGCRVTLTASTSDDTLHWQLANAAQGAEPACTRRHTGVGS
ncbi:pilin [Amnimonas aquatica]|uniref:Pilus assembly protein PilA n=1 Tax=Amnimonas aquatica TaxID=2094561 RepID=A0A2P6AQU6_9GAMM|nr:pilin [Amnimonas aquatica]PQA32183.1 hypothetical protein C5O18_08950 [Amnimonas aquatica]